MHVEYKNGFTRPLGAFSINIVHSAPVEIYTSRPFTILALSRLHAPNSSFIRRRYKQTSQHMNRFSVIYLLRKQYHHIDYATYSEADLALSQLSDQVGGKPIGIYDAKTELFFWEPTRQHQYDKASIEKQGKLGDQIIRIAQTLRHHDEVNQGQTNSISQLLEMNGSLI